MGKHQILRGKQDLNFSKTPIPLNLPELLVVNLGGYMVMSDKRTKWRIFLVFFEELLIVDNYGKTVP